MASELSKQKVDDVRAWLNKPEVLAELARAVRENVKPVTVARIVQSAMVRQPKLFDCSRHSLWGAILQSLELGLLPDGREAALIPYQIKGTLTCTFQPMYQGLVKLASNAGVVVIPPVSVYSNEKFKIQYGMVPPILHEPLPPDRRGEFVLCYSIAMVNGQPVPDYMWREDIDAIRDRSKGYQNALKYNDQENPWIRDYPEMAKKTVFKRQAKYLPKSAELSQALSVDDDAEFGHAGLSVDVIDAPVPTTKAAKLAANVRSKTPVSVPTEPEFEEPQTPTGGSPPPPNVYDPEKPDDIPFDSKPAPPSPIISGKRAMRLFNLISTADLAVRDPVMNQYGLSKIGLQKECLKFTEAQAEAIEDSLTPPTAGK